MYKLELLLYFVSRKSYLYLQTCEITNYKKDWVHKSQIRKVPHLRKVCKSNKLFKSANLRICGTYLRTAHLCLQRTGKGWTSCLANDGLLPLR
jgi:hypothetical protein